MLNSKRNGIYKLYYENGCELSSTDNSKRENLSLTNSLGKLCEEVNYIDDKKQGIYKSYYQNGQLCEEVNYIDDKRNGIFKSYHRNGCELSLTDNSKRENLLKTNSLGQLWFEVKYIDDILQ